MAAAYSEADILNLEGYNMDRASSGRLDNTAGSSSAPGWCTNAVIRRSPELSTQVVSRRPEGGFIATCLIEILNRTDSFSECTAKPSCLRINSSRRSPS